MADSSGMVVHRTAENEVVLAYADKAPGRLFKATFKDRKERELSADLERAIDIMTTFSQLLQTELVEQWEGAKRAANALKTKDVYFILTGDEVSLEGGLTGIFKLQFGELGPTDQQGSLWTVTRDLHAVDHFRHVCKTWHQKLDGPAMKIYVRFAWHLVDAARLNVRNVTSTVSAVSAKEAT